MSDMHPLADRGTLAAALDAFQSAHRMTDDQLAVFLRTRQVTIAALRRAPRPWSVEECRELARRLPVNADRLAAALSLVTVAPEPRVVRGPSL